MVKTSRRVFLGMLGASGLGAALTAWCVNSSHIRSRAQTRAQAAIIAIFRDLDGPVSVGRAYLERYPENKSFLKAGDNVFHLVPWWWAFAPVVVIQEAIKNQISTDYKDNRTVLVDGWLLSKTEAQACALVSLARN